MKDYTPDQLQAFAELSQAAIGVAQLLAAVGFGIWGFRAWRTEARGKRQAELAEDVLAAALESVDLIRTARSPRLSLSGTISFSADHPGCKLLVGKVDVFARLSTSALKAKHLLGVDVDSQVAAIQSTRDAFILACHSSGETEDESEPEMLKRQHLDHLVSRFDDQPNVKISTALRAISDLMMPFIEARK